MPIFTQLTNRLTGQRSWTAQNDDYDYQMELTCTSFGDMLHDHERNQKYYTALRTAITCMHAEGRQVNVLDIGTGTGILSMMAISAGADTVTACEAFMPMANCAERIFAANGFGDKVRLVKKRSTEMRVGEDMPQKANLLVAELLDTELIAFVRVEKSLLDSLIIHIAEGEGAIAIYNHAHEELLTDDVVCIPAKATCYAQVVQSPFAGHWNTMKLIADLDGNILLKPPIEVIQCRGDAAVHDVQLSQLRLGEHFLPLTEFTEIFVFDFNSKSRRDTQRQRLLQMEALRSGSTNLVFFWWDIKMYEGDETILSCAPYWSHPDYKRASDFIPWRDHWIQAIYYIAKPLYIAKKNEKFMLNCNHDEYSFWFDVHHMQNLDVTSLPRHACTCNLHLAYPRSRLGQINQSLRNKQYLSYMERNFSKHAHLLCLGDGFILALAAAKMDVASVLLYETQQLFSRRFMDSVRQANKVQNLEFIADLKRLEENQLSQLTHVFAEPYFLNSILPWDNFQFGNLLQGIIDKLGKTVQIAPHSAKIFAVPVQFLDLHKIHQPVYKCEGFDLSLFDDMIKQARLSLPDSKVEAHPLWEYPCKALAKSEEVLHVIFRNFNTEQSKSGTMSFERYVLQLKWHKCRIATFCKSTKFLKEDGEVSESALQLLQDRNLIPLEGTYLWPGGHKLKLTKHNSLTAIYGDAGMRPKEKN